MDWGGIHYKIQSHSLVLWNVYGVVWCFLETKTSFKCVIMLGWLGHHGIGLTEFNSHWLKVLWIYRDKNIREVRTGRAFKRTTVHSFNAWMSANATVSMTSFLCSEFAFVWWYTHLIACMRGRRRRDLSVTMESHCEDRMMALDESRCELFMWRNVYWGGAQYKIQSHGGDRWVLICACMNRWWYWKRNTIKPCVSCWCMWVIWGHLNWS